MNNTRLRQKWRYVGQAENLAVVYTAVLCVGVYMGVTCANARTDTCTITLQSTWQELQAACVPRDERSILVGIITFRTKLMKPIDLTTIVFSWHGTRLSHLYASLYRTEVNEIFLPIDQYWISDAMWNQDKQQLVFKIHNKKTLSAITNFHLVLSIPYRIEDQCKNGFFIIEAQSLPNPYQTIEQAQLTLRVDENVTHS